MAFKRRPHEKGMKGCGGHRNHAFNVKYTWTGELVGTDNERSLVCVPPPTSSTDIRAKMVNKKKERDKKSRKRDEELEGNVRGKGKITEMKEIVSPPVGEIGKASLR